MIREKKFYYYCFLFPILLLFIFKLNGQSEAVKNKYLFHSSAENILSEKHRCLLLPSSQSSVDINKKIENIMDGDLDTVYTGEKNSPDNWIELRWLQPVRINGLRIYLDKKYQPDYLTLEVPTTKFSWDEKIKIKAVDEQLKSFPEINTDRLRINFHNETKLQTISIRELELIGFAFETLVETPKWPCEYIWYPNEKLDDVTRYFRRTIFIPEQKELKKAFIQISVDDAYNLFCNGKKLGTGGIPPKIYDLSSFLSAGKNVIAVECHEYSIDEGLLAEIILYFTDGSEVRFHSDSKWLVSRTVPDNWQTIDFDDTQWVNAGASGRSNAAVPYQYKYIEGNDNNFRIENFRLESEFSKPGDRVFASIDIMALQKLSEDFNFKIKFEVLPVKGNNALYKIVDIDLKAPFPTSQWEENKTYTLDFQIKIPEWAPHKFFPLHVEAGSNYSLSTVESSSDFGISVRRFERTPLFKSQPAKAEVQNINGTLKLLVNDKELSPFIMANNSFDNLQILGEHAQVKAPIHRLGIGGNYYIEDNQKQKEEFKRIFAVLDQRVDMLLRLNPDTYIIPSTSLWVPRTWSENNKEDTTVLPDGQSLQHSFSSQKYLDQSIYALKKLVTYLRNAPYAGHIIGLHFGIGDGPETYYWGAAKNHHTTKRNELILGDFSPVALDNFRNWLKKKYSLSELRQAWQNDQLAFETLKPDLQELQGFENGVFSDPGKSRMSMDFWEFQADAMAHTAKVFAEAIKEASNREIICGLWGFYNVGMNHCRSSPGYAQHVAYNAVEKILPDPNLDYLAGIQGYAGVNQGTPVVNLFTYDSLKKHNKLCLIEYDIRTFFTDLTFSLGHHYSQRESLEIIKRDFGESMVHNFMTWWVGFSHGEYGRRSIGWYAENSLKKILAECKDIAEKTYKYDNESQAELALFINDRDIVSMDVVHGSPILVNTQYHSITKELCTSGIPYEIFSMSDFNAQTIKKFKLIAFLNAFYLGENERKQISNLLNENKSNTIFLYAPGLIDRKTGINLKNVEELSGFKLRMDSDIQKNHLNARVKINNKSLPFSDINDHIFGPTKYLYAQGEFLLSPVLSIVDEDAEVIGNYVSTSAVAIAKKQLAGRSSYFVTVPIVSDELWRAIAKDSGLHLYIEDNQKVFLDASSRFLSFHATDKGYQGEIYLPRESSLYDVFNKQNIIKNSKQFTLNLQQFESKLFFLGNNSEIKELESAFLMNK